MSVPAENPPASGVRNKSGHKNLRTIFWTLLLLLIAAFTVWRVHLARHVRGQLDTISRAGYPVTLAELQQQYYAPLKPEENAALLFTQAFTNLAGSNLVKQLDFFYKHRVLPSNSVMLSPEGRERLAGLLQSHSALLVTLHQVPPNLKSRYPINLSKGYDTELPHLAPLDESLQIVLLAAVSQASQGKTADAAEDFQAALRLSQSLADEPFLISQLVRMRARNAFNSALERVLTLGPLTDDQLHALSRAGEAEFNDVALQRALVGELCSFIDWHRNPRPRPSNRTGKNSVDGDPSKSDDSLRSTPMRFLGFLDLDLDYFLSRMFDLIQSTGEKFPGQIQFANGLRRRITRSTGNHLHVPADLTLNAYDGIAFRNADDHARFRLRQTALAMERYRLAHQDQLPERLDALVPAFLSEVPSDPYDGEPLRYKKLEKGYLLYSVARDRNDDGGLAPVSVTNPQSPYDLTFTVER